MGRARPPGEAKVGARRGRDKQGTVCLSVHRDCDVMEKSRGAGTRLQGKACLGAGRQASNLLMELEGGGRRPAAAAAAQAECLNRTGAWRRWLGSEAKGGRDRTGERRRRAKWH